ncbi:DUF1631 family protein [Luteimonas sp. A277]
MVKGQPGQDRRDGGAGIPDAALVVALEAGVAAQLLPLLTSCIEAEKAALLRQMRAEAPPHDGAEDIANLNIIAGQIITYERRWKIHFHRAFARWPDPPRVEVHEAFSLVSDDELQAQLIGQPTIEALERRHADVLDTIDRRLWSLAVELGGKVRPANPFSPQHLVDSFLYTFTPADCGPRLRAALLRHFERLAGESLVGVYGWCNRQLADAGCALAGVSDYATLAATMVSARRGDAARGWGEDNALVPADAGRRGEPAATSHNRSDAVRGNVLRHRVRSRREARGGRAPGVRSLRPEEFLAVLSLLQGELVSPVDPHSGYGRLMRNGLDRVAGSLGIDSASARPSVEQEDALDLIGMLFDQLAAHHQLSSGGREWLPRLSLPYLRLALAEPGLFEHAPQPAATRLLSLLVELWDGNRRIGPHDAGLHDLADEAAREVVDGYHGDDTAFARALARLESALEPLRRRAAVSERRAWQAIEGGERLEAARREADRELASRLHERPLLPAVTVFLEEYWRQSLVQAWLRAGPESERYAAARELGDALVRLDADAEKVQGAQVAARLIDLQPRLHDCYAALGLESTGVGSQVATLVGELANPDAARRVHGFKPLAQTAGTDGPAAVADGLEGLDPGRILVQMEAGEPVRTLRIAWCSPLSGDSLLVGAQGTRELLLSPEELAGMLADGRLLPRPVEGAVEAALRRIERTLGCPAAE